MSVDVNTHKKISSVIKCGVKDTTVSSHNRMIFSDAHSERTSHVKKRDGREKPVIFDTTPEGGRQNDNKDLTVQEI